tara:strand:+ start:8574 stop:9176 length:603 start_codon:yes stop_codon:yes gene_type:complete
MQRLTFENTNLNPNFVGSWIIEPTSICDEIIEYFEINQTKHAQGVTISGLNKNHKNRTDITLLPKEINHEKNKIFKTYFNLLFECYKDYHAQWPLLKKSIGGNLKIGRFNIGRYQAGQHFNEIHSERCSLDSLHRLFAFMTYLNDVDDGGSTYFSHYDLEVKPSKGLTILWPAEWTHSHKGNMIRKGTKYIITGWLNFCS